MNYSQLPYLQSQYESICLHWKKRTLFSENKSTNSALCRWVFLQAVVGAPTFEFFVSVDVEIMMTIQSIKMLQEPMCAKSTLIPFKAATADYPATYTVGSPLTFVK